MAKDVKVGVRRGGGPPPGYRWNVDILDVAFEEAMDFLTEDQYHHLAQQFQELARERDPTHSVTASVDAVEEFHELRDKGGILGSMNIRVFFLVIASEARMVILGAIRKQNDGPTPIGDKHRMDRRRRMYLRGDYSRT